MPGLMIDSLRAILTSAIFFMLDILMSPEQYSVRAHYDISPKPRHALRSADLLRRQMLWPRRRHITPIERYAPAARVHIPPAR